MELKILVNALFIFQTFLLATLSDALIAKGNQIGGILFDSGADSLGEFFQSVWIVLVLGTKVLDAHGCVLGQLKGLVLIVGSPLVWVNRCREMHGDLAILCFCLL